MEIVNWRVCNKALYVDRQQVDVRNNEQRSNRDNLQQEGQREREGKLRGTKIHTVLFKNEPRMATTSSYKLGIELVIYTNQTRATTTLYIIYRNSLY